MTPIEGRICTCDVEARRIIIDCTVNATYPRPEKHATQFKDLHRHWTISPHYLERRRDMQLVVNYLTCGMCHRAVIR